MSKPSDAFRIVDQAIKKGKFLDNLVNVVADKLMPSVVAQAACGTYVSSSSCYLPVSTTPDGSCPGGLRKQWNNYTYEKWKISATQFRYKRPSGTPFGSGNGCNYPPTFCLDDCF